jgi:hypothetical protein
MELPPPGRASEDGLEGSSSICEYSSPEFFCIRLGFFLFFRHIIIEVFDERKLVGFALWML